MKASVRFVFFSLSFFCLIIYFISCTSGHRDNKYSSSHEDAPAFLNHHDTAKYVGMSQCKLCHQQIYNSFMHTGMGMSFDAAGKTKTSADFSGHPVLYDKYSDFYYHPFWQGDTFKIKEYRLSGKDTVYKNIQSIDYIIGSGQHTNSHMVNINGYVYQAPVTFYTQKGKWDLPPGFENGHNTRFTRKIGLECMSCHNAYPDFVKGSENKYSHVPKGIDCERCHGPGNIHVLQKTAGNIVDTSKYIDYSIVNPGKLPVDLQFDVCQRCHLQGNTVLKEGKSFYDFKPGTKLSDVMTIFLPRYSNSETDFIMASHADRLKMSKCFIKSLPSKSEKAELRPYKNSLTCVTCHNPHVSVRSMDKEIFIDKCNNCHSGAENKMCSEKGSARMLKKNNCISCHMPGSGSSDIPHVSITDHYIRKPVSVQEQNNIKQFISLYAVNEKNPSNKTLAKAYINQFEKFEAESYYLDSAKKLLDDNNLSSITENINELVHLNYLRGDNDKVIGYVNAMGADQLLSSVLTRRSLDNYDAWICYRIGQSFSNKGDNSNALKFYNQAVQLAPFISEFKNKLAGLYILQRADEKAFILLSEIIKEEPAYAPAYSNLGYWYLLNNDPAKALVYYDKALAIDPDYEQGLLNKAGLYLYLKEIKKAELLLKDVIRRFPDNKIASDLLRQLSGKTSS